MKLVMVFLALSTSLAFGQTPDPVIKTSKPTNTNLTLKKKEKTATKNTKKSIAQNSIQLLLSGNFSVYEQKQTDFYTKYSSLNYANFYFNWQRYFNANWAIGISYLQSQGQIGSNQNNISDVKKYLWKVISLGSSYRRTLPIELFDSKYGLILNFGFQQHDLPILISNNDTKFIWHRESLTALSLGGGLDITLSPVSVFNLLLDYQIPIVRSVNVPKKQKFIFSGSTSWSYKLTENFFSKISWYGQWANFNQDLTLFQSSFGLGGEYWF